MELGRITALFRYPIKSMAGESLDVTRLGWHGIDGDRRFAFRRLNDDGGFPWLSAGKLPELVLYKPVRHNGNTPPRHIAEVLQARAIGMLPTHVRTPGGMEYELRSNELREEISNRLGTAVELMNLRSGIFDEASISIISLATVREIERQSSRSLDLRRFRPNIVIETIAGEPFQEDKFVGHTLTFGEGNNAPSVAVTMRDERCVMINLDPNSAEKDSEVMKTVVRLNQNCAGIYATVVGTGELRVGQTVTIHE